MSDISIISNSHSDAKLNLTHWPYPKPLIAHYSESQPYPVDALPSVLQKTVSAYQAYGQQPIPLITSSALANISLACQSLADVARDNYLVSPLSLYFLTVASSGERKSAADNAFSKAIRLWERKMRQKREPALISALTQHKAWQMERDGLLSKIKRAMINGQDSDYEKELLEELAQEEPDIPIQPTLYFEDTTQEGLALHLSQGWPSASLWSDEGGIILGGHGMQANPTRFVALLNRLWEGKAFTTHRKTSQSFVVENRRLTVNIMLQPLLFEPMSKQSGSIIRQSGFLARCLLAYPTTNMGQRFYQEPPDLTKTFVPYNNRITECLNQSEYLNQSGCLQLPILTMSNHAKKIWIQFYNSLETGLKPNLGQWVDVKDIASKASENAARLAALFHLFEGKIGNINAEHITQAIEIIHWYLQEAKRLLEPQDLNPSLQTAQKLLDWILERRNQTITLREILQLSPVRNKTQRDEAIAILIEHHWLRLVKEKNKMYIQLNPKA